MKKRKNWKVIIPVALVLCGTFLFSVPVSATEVQNQRPPETIAYVQEIQEAISPRYIALTRLDATLSISSNGCATCTGNANVSVGSTCDVTLELQRKNGSSWDTIKTWTSSGRANSFNDIWYVTSGHSYQIKITAEVYNSIGQKVETASATSATVNY